MTRSHLLIRLPALFLALTVSLPNSALALRPEGPGDSRTLQLKLRAGMEERSQTDSQQESLSVVKRRLGDSLNDLREEASRELRQDIQWPREFRSPRNRLHFLFRVFLLHPSPYAVRDRVQNLLKRIDSDILPDLRRVDDWVEFLPKADDWLGFQLSYNYEGGLFKQMTRALAIYSEEASAKMFARQGAHLRADFVEGDWADIEIATVLMKGFLPRLINLLDQVERGDLENKAEARRYAAALFNGLMIPSRNGHYSLSEYKGYFAQWMRNIEFIANPEAVLGRALRTFPDLFPENPNRLPLFLEFHNRQFLYEEMEPIVRYNRKQPPEGKVTLWGLVAGDRAAQGYMRIYNQTAKNGAKRELLRLVYEYLLQKGKEALAAAGAEEKDVSLESRILGEMESLRVETERRLGIKVDTNWHKFNYPKHRMVALANTFLRHPDPLSAKKKVRGLMRRMDRQILGPLLRADPRRLSKEMQELREWALILPVADDWLVRALSPPDRVSFLDRTRALSIYSKRAAAMAFGRTGPHLRANFISFDRDDLEAASILLQAFLPQTERLLKKARLSRRGRVPNQSLKLQAEEYAGALFNGLVIPGEQSSSRPFEDYKAYFRKLEEKSQGRLRSTIKRTASVFPDHFPADPRKMPDFLRFSNRPFAHQEMGKMQDFNRSTRGPPITLWQLTAGTGAADDYIRYLQKYKRRLLSRHQPLMERVYGYLLEQGGVVFAPAAGAEEKVEILPYGANIDITVILRGLDVEDQHFDGEVSKTLLKALATARAERRKARVLIVGAGAGAVLYDVQQLLGNSPDAEVVFINKQQIELNSSADKAAGVFAEEVIQNRKLIEFGPALQEARQFLREFRRDGVIRNVSLGFPTEEEDQRFRDESFDVVMATSATLPYIPRKVPLFREIERVLRVGGTAFISDAYGFLTNEIPPGIFFRFLTGNRYEYAPDNLRIDKQKSGISFPSLPRASYTQGSISPEFDPEIHSPYVPPEEMLGQYARLQEQVARIATTAELADLENERQIVVVDLSALIKSPQLSLLLAKLDRLAPRVIVFRSAPVINDLRRSNSRLVFAPNELALREILDALRSTRDITSIFFLGAPARAKTVEQMAETMGLGFIPSSPSLAALLTGLGVPANLAAELTAGVEEADLLGAEA